MKFILFTLLCIYLCSAKEFGAGSCPNFPVQKDFSTEKFQGSWIPVYQSCSRFAACTILNFTVLNPFSMDIDVKTALPNTVSLKYSGNAHSTNKNKPASMQWVFNSHLVPIFEKVTILDTDYSNYAVIIMCSDYGLFYRMTGVVLARDLHVDKSFLKKAKNLLVPYCDLKHNRYIGCWFDFSDKQEEFNDFDLNKAMEAFAEFVGVFTDAFQGPSEKNSQETSEEKSMENYY